MRIENSLIRAAIVLSTSGSCAGIHSELCDSSPEDVRCKISPITGTLASAQRLYYHYNDALAIKTPGKDYHTKLVFSDNTEVILNDVKQGQSSLKIDLSTNSKLGSASLHFMPVDGSAEEVDPIRLYAKTSLQPTGNPFSPNGIPNSDGQPVKIGIGTIKELANPNVLISLNILSTGNNIAKVYQYDKSQQKIVYPKNSATAFDQVTNLSSIAVVQDALVKTYYQSSGGNYPSYVGYCSNAIPSVCTTGVKLGDNAQPPMGPQVLADVRPNSSIYAILTNVKQIDVYNLVGMDVTKSPVTFPNDQWASDTSLSLAAIGDIDGDQKGDLIAWQKTVSMNKILVFTHGASGFEYSQPFSQALQMVLGADDIGAIAAGDLDGDGIDDIAIARGATLSTTFNETMDSGKPIFGALSTQTAPVAADFTVIDQIAVGMLRPPLTMPTDRCSDIAISTKGASGWLEAYINNPS